MNSSVLQNLLPASLGIIMFGIGLHLTVNDFLRIIKNPKPILIGLLVQSVILPFFCFLIARNFGLSNELAVGLMLLAASPGGVTANLYSHLFGGNVALNISLTAINSILIIFTMPIIVNLSIDYFMGSDQQILLQFGKIIEVVAIVILPVSIGMFLNYKSPSLSKKFEKIIKIASALILCLLIVGILIKENKVIFDHIGEVGFSTFLFCVLSLTLGYFSGKIFGLKEPESRALAFEIGIHNATLSIYLALNVLSNSLMSIPSAVYSLLMFPLAAIFGFIVTKLSFAK
jgi:bile acid:Na+ symporter, BASS family